MVPAQVLQPLPANPDGTINARDALLVIIANNTRALNNAEELSALQDWLKATEKNVDH
jgi:hypothetical protein